MRRTHRKEPKQARSKALVDALLTATEHVVAELGLDGATTEAIAARAGVSIGSLYQYFADKEALLAAAIARRSAQGNDAMVAEAEDGSRRPLHDAIDAMVRLLVKTFAAEPAVYASLDREADRVGEQSPHREDLERVIEASRVLLAAHKEAIAPRDPATSAFVLTVACTSVVRDATASRPELLANDTLIDELNALCLGYLGQA